MEMRSVGNKENTQKLDSDRRERKRAQRKTGEMNMHITTSNNSVHLNLSYRMKENGRLVVAVMVVVILKRGETHYNR